MHEGPGEDASGGSEAERPRHACGGRRQRRRSCSVCNDSPESTDVGDIRFPSSADKRTSIWAVAPGPSRQYSTNIPPNLSAWDFWRPGDSAAAPEGESNVRCPLGLDRALSGALRRQPAGRGRAADQDARERAVLRDFNAAAALQNSGLYDRAGEKWTAFISQYPGDSRLDRAYTILACPASHQEIRRGDRHFPDALSKYPAFPNGEGAQYSLGMARYQAAMASRIREDFQVGRRVPRRGRCQVSARQAHRRRTLLSRRIAARGGQSGAAMEAYKKLIATFPTSPLVAEAYYALGTTQQEAGRDSEAIETFRKFLGTRRWPATSWPRKCGCGWGYRS